MTTLVVCGITSLGVIVGYALGVRHTSQRYQDALRQVHNIDLVGAKKRE